jgi:hypothetical protein
LLSQESSGASVEMACELAVLTRAADDPCPIVKSYAIAKIKEVKQKDEK